jgi:hypothetical protein
MVEQIVQYRSGKALGEDLSLTDFDSPRGDGSASNVI